MDRCWVLVPRVVKDIRTPVVESPKGCRSVCQLGVVRCKEKRENGSVGGT